ncbi:2-dehydropantoate 2-reductase [Vibrio mediterranei]|uniref:2-dehydropantoate 2-reductase n=1 Tax=Vibrio mediterranei TaxID=689 RepID=UPI0007852915|nr:2-dehydropantoate 2-reductase [Vibrio mediterranei]MCG9660982.1 2-dehydropantoate 2-reductase [Vibrio mediterranei]MCG9664869.1 2-dehydropantoate 2-reductase [Vibrio mediterranei]SBO11438.1 2-dehydropantoate 2-reductase [Vibrio mediterranei]
MSKKVFAVIGTGAIGGYYGARLHHGGNDVHFLFNSDYQHVIKNGLKVDSHYGDYSISAESLNAYNATCDMPKADVVLVALKTTQNHLLEALLRPLLKPNTLVMLLQNGIGAEREVAEQFNLPFVGGGLCFICSNKVAPGHIDHIDYGRITIGTYGDSGIEALEDFANHLTQSGVEVDVDQRIIDARWKKLLWNVPFNGLSTVLNADTAEMMSCEELVNLSKEIMIEVQHAAKTTDTDISDTLIDTMLSNTAKMKPYLTSMLLDRRNHRELEIQYMYKNAIDLAKDQDVAMPKTQALYEQLCFINNQIKSVK